MYDDLFQAGVLGLIEANKRFDEKRNVKFVTYAYYWVYEHMRREVRKSVKDEEVLCNDLSTFDKPVDARDLIEEKENKEVVKYLASRHLLKCSKRDRAILKRRFGIDCKYERGIDVAKEFHLSEARIGQIVKKVVLKIREALQNNLEEI